MDVLPTHISHYEIRRVLGQGGMGVVYLAFDPGLQRQVAVKVLRTNSDDQRERLRREARIVAKLQHPNIVAIYGVGEHDAHPYIAMEYIAGEPLSEAIRRRAPWGLQRKLVMGAELCAGLAFAHRAGVIHRDVKPSNLIVANGPGTIRLLDFGIARGIDAGATMGLTMQGNIVGTLNYMSPEQITGRPIDHRSDIFAVGLVLYELITYRKAFPGDNLATLTYRIVHSTPEPIRSLLPDVDEELCAVVERAMARQPEDRYPNLEALRTDLLRIASRLTPSAAALLAPDESADQPLPAPAIWSRALEATAESDAPHTPGPRTMAPTALLPGVEAESRPPAWRFWPVAVAVGGVALGGATTLWLTTDRDPTPRPGVERERGQERGDDTQGQPFSEDTRFAGGIDANASGRPPLEAAAPPAAPVAPPNAAGRADSAVDRPTTAAAPVPTRPAPASRSAPNPVGPGASAGVANAPAPRVADEPPAGREEPSPAEPAAPAPPVSTRPESASVPAVTAEPRPAPPSDDEQIRGVLARWARAYSAMDARAVDEEQPGSAAALSKAFSNLRSVAVDLTACRVDVQGNRATAACTEHIRTEGVVAGGSLNTSRGRQFVLQKNDGRWRITSARIGS